MMAMLLLLLIMMLMVMPSSVLSLECYQCTNDKSSAAVDLSTGLLEDAQTVVDLIKSANVKATADCSDPFNSTQHTCTGQSCAKIKSKDAGLFVDSAITVVLLLSK